LNSLVHLIVVLIIKFINYTILPLSCVVFSPCQTKFVLWFISYGWFGWL